MSDLEEFRFKFVPRQIEAEIALHEGDAGPRIALWSRNDPVTVLGAGGMSLSGWEEVGKLFEWVATRFSDVSDYRYDVEAVGVSGDLAYTVGFERYKGSIDGSPVKEVVIRVTHAYRREDGEWKIVHRHGDSPEADQRAAQKGSEKS